MLCDSKMAGAAARFWLLAFPADSLGVLAVCLQAGSFNGWWQFDLRTSAPELADFGLDPLCGSASKTRLYSPILSRFSLASSQHNIGVCGLADSERGRGKVSLDLVALTVGFLPLRPG